MKFLDAMNELVTKGNGFRMCREGSPGLVAWVISGTLECNGKLSVADFNAADWTIFEDDTVIR